MMGTRKGRSPEEQERRAKIWELLQLSGVSSMADIQELFKETIAEFMEDGLDAELTEELGYSRYTTTRTRRQKTAGTGTVPRSCEPAMGRWISPSPGTGRGRLSRSC